MREAEFPAPEVAVVRDSLVATYRRLRRMSYLARDRPRSDPLVVEIADALRTTRALIHRPAAPRTALHA
jgi:hypothetical protein